MHPGYFIFMLYIYCMLCFVSIICLHWFWFLWFVSFVFVFYMVLTLFVSSIFTPFWNLWATIAILVDLWASFWRSLGVPGRVCGHLLSQSESCGPKGGQKKHRRRERVSLLGPFLVIFCEKGECIWGCWFADFVSVFVMVFHCSWPAWPSIRCSLRSRNTVLRFPGYL